MRLEQVDRQRLLKAILPLHHPPALANERGQLNTAGPVMLKLKTPRRDGSTRLVTSPLEFMRRLAALVPRPRPPFSSLVVRN